jgi:hypothetical protein
LLRATEVTEPGSCTVAGGGERAQQHGPWISTVRVRREGAALTTYWLAAAASHARRGLCNRQAPSRPRRLLRDCLLRPLGGRPAIKAAPRRARARTPAGRQPHGSCAACVVDPESRSALPRSTSHWPHLHMSWPGSLRRMRYPLFGGRWRGCRWRAPAVRVAPASKGGPLVLVNSSGL